jgi:hypothetical protein
MYQYILVCTSTYWYVPVHTGLSSHKLFYEYVMNVQTSTYACSPFCTCSKKVQTGLEPAIFCILLAECTPALLEYKPERRIYAVLSSMYILLAIAICLNNVSAKLQDVTCWALNIRQFNDHHTSHS